MAVVSCGGIVIAQSIGVAGDELDTAIVQHVKKEYSLLLGERTAEQVKIGIGAACDLDSDEHTEIRGQDLVSRQPKTVVISAAEMRKAIEEPVYAIAASVFAAAAVQALVGHARQIVLSVIQQPEPPYQPKPPFRECPWSSTAGVPAGYTARKADAVSPRVRILG